jgi:ribonucleoside-triphosphate reductase
VKKKSGLKKRLWLWKRKEKKRWLAKCRKTAASVPPLNKMFFGGKDMENLEAIETKLTAAREALRGVKGTPTEVYSRIVGYYRSVRNWNKGKREEYGQRLMFQPDASLLASCKPVTEKPAAEQAENKPADKSENRSESEMDIRLLLFILPACPACPSAKVAASRLGIPLELYDADTDTGLAEATRYQVMSTPTAILLSANGKELARARDAETIGKLLEKSA